FSQDQNELFKCQESEIGRYPFPQPSLFCLDEAGGQDNLFPPLWPTLIMSVQMSLEDEFCDIIKKARFGQGLGIETLAELAKMEQAEVERLEKGHRPPTKGEIQGISQALHLRVGP